jgi:hypothetical protein
MLPPGYREHRARQEVGSLRYQILKSPNRRFEVETPYAALVVKGTTFDVDVNQDGVAIDVGRGLVGVESRGGATADVGAGHAARVSSADSHALEVRRESDGPFVRVEPASASWFQRFLDDLQSGPAPVSGQGGGGQAGGGGSSTGGTGGAGSGGAGSGSADRGGVGVEGASVGGASVGGASVGGASVGGASAGRGGVSVGGVSGGGVSVGGASIGRGGISVGGAQVGGVSVGGASIGRGGISVGGAQVGGIGVGGIGIGRR